MQAADGRTSTNVNVSVMNDLEDLGRCKVVVLVISRYALAAVATETPAGKALLQRWRRVQQLVWCLMCVYQRVLFVKGNRDGDGYRVAQEQYCVSVCAQQSVCPSVCLSVFLCLSVCMCMCVCVCVECLHLRAHVCKCECGCVLVC